MTAELVPGQRTWELSEDDEGYREYTLKLLIRADPLDGPAVVRACPGLPLPGSVWDIDNDLDQWVWCKRGRTFRPVLSNEPNRLWEADFKYSNKPDKRCQDHQFEDPLMAPPDVSGSFVKAKEAATHDRHGRRILSSSWEQLIGPNTEFDAGTSNVKIVQNVLDLQRPLLEAWANAVNAYELWGQKRRCVKLSGWSFAQKYYGNCYKYYQRTLEFEVNAKTWDRNILDEGNKVLKGHWGRGKDGETWGWQLEKIDGRDPDMMNPSHFIRFKDRKGENAKVVLDGRGRPFDPEELQRLYYWCVGYPYDERVIDLYVKGSIDPYGECMGPLSCADVFAQTVGTPYDGMEIWGPFLTAGDCAAACSDDFPAGTGRMPSVKDCLQGDPGQIHVEKYGEADFLALGIPTEI